MTDADLLNALRDCYHPRLHRNIVEIGMVRTATLVLDPDAPGARIPGVPERFVARIGLTAHGTDDDADTLLAAQVQNRLAGLPQIARTELRLLPPLFPILTPVPQASR